MFWVIVAVIGTVGLWWVKIRRKRKTSDGSGQ